MEKQSDSRGKVLVVDDDPVVLAVIEDCLTDAGYEVHTREEALGTTEYVAAVRPDFVLLDVQMPALSGGELAQLMRRHERTLGAAVILHSSIDSSALDFLVAKTGALGAVQKTANVREFLASFERLTALHRSALRSQVAAGSF